MERIARKLIVLSGENKNASFLLTGATVDIGRDDDNALCLGDDCVSRHHAILVRDHGEYVLRDLDSRNGTFLNEQPAQEARLKSGDQFRIGEVEIRYETTSAPTFVASPLFSAPPAAAQPNANELADLRHQLTLTQQRLAEAEKQVSERAMEVESVRRAFAVAVESVSDLKELEQRNKTLSIELSAAQQEAAELRGSVQQTAEDLARVRVQSEEAARDQQQHIAQLTQEIERLGAELSAARETLATTQAAVERLSGAERQAENLAIQLTSEKESTQALRAVNEQQAVELQEAADKETSLIAVVKRLEPARKEVHQLREELAQAQNNASKLAEDNHGLQSALDTLCEKLTVVRRESQEQLAVLDQQAAAQLAGLRAELDQARRGAEHLAATTNENQELQTKLTALHLHVAEVERRAAEHEAVEIARLEAELAETRIALQHGNEELAVARAAARRLDLLGAERLLQEQQLLEKNRQVITKLEAIEETLERLRLLSKGGASAGLKQVVGELGQFHAQLERIDELQTRTNQLALENSNLQGALEKAQEELVVARRSLSEQMTEEFNCFRQNMKAKGDENTGRLPRQLGAIRRILNLW